MTDQFDRAQELEQMTRDIALQKHRTFKESAVFFYGIFRSSNKNPASM